MFDSSYIFVFIKVPKEVLVEMDCLEDKAITDCEDRQVNRELTDDRAKLVGKE
jgi:hypothetical protein